MVGRQSVDGENVGTRSCSRPGFHLGAPRLAITNQLDATSRARARLSSVDSDWLGALGQAGSQGRSKAVQPASGSLTSRFELVRRLRIDAASPRHAWRRRAGRRAPRRDIRPFYLCCPEPGPWPDTAADSGGSVPGTDHMTRLTRGAVHSGTSTDRTRGPSSRSSSPVSTGTSSSQGARRLARSWWQRPACQQWTCGGVRQRQAMRAPGPWPWRVRVLPGAHVHSSPPRSRAHADGAVSRVSRAGHRTGRILETAPTRAGMGSPKRRGFGTDADRAAGLMIGISRGAGAFKAPPPL